MSIVGDEEQSKMLIERIPMVKEFTKVFSDELPSLPLVIPIDFAIDLQPRTTDDSKFYRLF